MKKDALLKSIADLGYNVGFGGRKHWATYDIVEKVPGLIGFISMAIGIFALVVDVLSAKIPSATLLVLGVASLYISYYDHKKDQYENSARELTKLYEALRDLYREVYEITVEPTQDYQTRLETIRKTYYDVSLSKQILFSDWYAHYKFYWQYQIDWVDEQKNFRLFRDKLPLSLMFWTTIFIIGGLAYLYQAHGLPLWCTKALHPS